ncbi:creatininase family protein [Vallitalea okinawensis]|uniref:creatininase family protein n=1 Tax=Vallitalea okinawensis TaxID=2078660 RepID=UPI001FA9309D|nr:creatininase family protein [Vallitalea okinawensis]
MKNYSIFKDTMADMSFTEVEKLIKKEAVVLFPIGVIEEHGPHLPLGTDTYIAYSMFRHTQQKLTEMAIPSVLAPPFYWGINSITDGFTGSFTVKVDTMKALLKDSMECLANWGFKKVYLYNLHGDLKHVKTIIEIVEEIYQSNLTLEVYFLMSEFHQKRCGLNGDEPYILAKRREDIKENTTDKVNTTPTYIDCHGGGLETSLMLMDFDDLVDEPLARELKSSKTTIELFEKWRQGGKKAKEVTPLGYCGDPSNIRMDDARNFVDATSLELVELISKTLE